MENHFFQNLSALLSDGCLTIVVKKGITHELIVSILATNDKVGDNAKNAIVPLTFKGTATEIDQNFFDKVAEPIILTNELLVNMEDYLQKLADAKVKSQMEADKAKAEKTAKDERKKKFDALIKKVEELDGEKKFKEAIEQLYRSADLIEHTDEIKKRISELQAKSQPTIF